MADRNSKNLTNAYDEVNNLRYRYQDMFRDNRYSNRNFRYFLADLSDLFTDKIEWISEAMCDAIGIIDELEEENKSLQKQIEELESKLEDLSNNE